MGSANGKQAEGNIQNHGGEKKADDDIRPMRPRTNSTLCVLPNKIIQNEYRTK